MQVESGQIVQVIGVSDEFTLNGQALEDVTVLMGGSFCLNGMVAKNLIVDAGGEAFVHGTVAGDITNNGGTVEIFGCVLGRIHELAGRTVVNEGASVANK